VWVGADPGGRNAFGLAILTDDGGFTTHCVSCADDAIQHVKARPAGVGIDAPMWWSSGPSGDRRADRWIRNRYQIGGGTVQAANSLRGAALVQGVLFAERARQLFKKVPITEAHPKAVLRALKLSWAEFCSVYSIGPTTGDVGAENEHCRDAVVAAVAAREGCSGHWTVDLTKDRQEEHEQDPFSYWLAPVHYFWPQRGP
jgi:predicted nuclease with RNAse H fold